MGNEIYIVDGQFFTSDELYHHGIKGQKWGVRRYQNKDGSLTPAGRKRRKSDVRYGKAEATTTASRDHSKSDKLPLAKFAANVALDILYLNPVGAAMDTARLVQAGKGYIDSKKYDKERETCQIDKKTGLLLKKQDMTMKQDSSRVNPLVHNFDNNTKNNCMLCTATYDLRRRGYEVKAKKASYGYRTEDVLAWYPKAKINKITGLNDKGRPSTKDMMTKVKDELAKQGDGARGNLMIRWAGMTGGHSVAYEVSNGNLLIIDAQVNKIYNNPDQFLRRCASEVEYVRLDNVGFNVKTIKEVAE